LKESRVTSLHQRRSFEIRAKWDAEAGAWWCSNDELPLPTEAPIFEQLVSRVLEIVREIAAENALALPGDEIEVHVIAERVESVPVVAAASMPATFDRELRRISTRAGCYFVRPESEVTKSGTARSQVAASCCLPRSLAATRQMGASKTRDCRKPF
jgi:Domain of unknown function (DUF1902)